MTEREAGSHLDDERLSAALDGLAAPEDTAHLEGCEPCRARLAVWQEDRRLVGSPPAPPGADVMEAAVAAALEAGGSPALEAGESPRPAGPRPAAPRPGSPRGVARPSGRPRGLARPAAQLVGLAAAVALVLGLVVGLRHGGSSAKSSSGAVSATTAAGASAAAGAASSGEPSSVESTVPQPADLGRVDSAPALRGALLAPGVPKTATGPFVCEAAATTAASHAAGAGGTPAPRYQVRLTYQQHPAHATVFTTRSGQLAVVTADAGCAVLATAAL